MKNNNITKAICLILVVGLSIWSLFSVSNITEKRYFPKFEYSIDSKGVVFKASDGSRKTEVVHMVPVIDISSLNNLYTVNYSKLICCIPANYSQPNVYVVQTFFGLTIDKNFIYHCIRCGITNNNVLTRIPFILEIEFVKRNGKGTQKQAYMFEYLQRNNEFMGIRFVKKLNVRRLYNKSKYLIRNIEKQLSLCEDEETPKIIGYNDAVELNSVVDSTFSFN